MKGVGVVLVIPFLTNILKWSDLTIAIVGVFLSIMFYILLAFASTKLLMFVGKLLSTFGILSISVIDYCYFILHHSC